MGKPSFVLIHLIQPYDAFYMVGVGEHVYGLNFFGAIAALCEKIITKSKYPGVSIKLILFSFQRIGTTEVLIEYPLSISILS